MDKVLQMIGMAKRAGKLATGEMFSKEAIKKGESKLIIIASDISKTSEKSIVNACEYYDVSYIKYADKEKLGKITGGGEKAVVSVNDSGFRDAIMKKYSAAE